MFLYNNIIILCTCYVTFSIILIITSYCCCHVSQVRVRRIQIFPLFEDYDRVHIGSVTRSQVLILVMRLCNVYSYEM